MQVPSWLVGVLHDHQLMASVICVAWSAPALEERGREIFRFWNPSQNTWVWIGSWHVYFM